MATVLIIDDEPSVLSYIADRVQDLGHTVIPAATGQDGLEAIGKNAIDIVVADLYLPDFPDVNAWLQAIRSAAAGRPLILVTGFPSDELAELARSGGIAGFLTKPFELVFLDDLLKDLCRERKA